MAKGTKRSKLQNKTKNKNFSSGLQMVGKSKNPLVKKKLQKLYPHSHKKISLGLLDQRHKFERKQLRDEIDALYEKRVHLSKSTLEGKQAYRELTQTIHKMEEDFEKRITHEIDLFKEGNIQLLVTPPSDLYTLRGSIVPSSATQGTTSNQNTHSDKFVHLLVGSQGLTPNSTTQSNTEPNFDIIYSMMNANSQDKKTTSKKQKNMATIPVKMNDEEDEETVVTSSGTPSSFIQSVSLKKSLDTLEAEAKAQRRQHNKEIRDSKRLKSLRSGRSGPFAQFLGDL